MACRNLAPVAARLPAQIIVGMADIQGVGVGVSEAAYG